MIAFTAFKRFIRLYIYKSSKNFMCAGQKPQLTKHLATKSPTEKTTSGKIIHEI